LLNKTTTKGGKKATNKIFYYYETRHKADSQDKLELLEANQVTTIEITEQNKTKYYTAILEQIKRSV
jgi:hypothetical protein